jgi:hypothetical protein
MKTIVPVLIALALMSSAAHAQHVGAATWMDQHGKVASGVTYDLAEWKSILRPGHTVSIIGMMGSGSQGVGVVTDLWTQEIETRMSTLYAGVSMTTPKVTGGKWVPALVVVMKIKSGPK